MGKNGREGEVEGEIGGVGAGGGRGVASSRVPEK